MGEACQFWTRAVRRRHCVGGGAPVNFGRRWRPATGPKKSAAARWSPIFSKDPQKFRSVLKNFWRPSFLVVHRKLPEKVHTRNAIGSAPTNYRRRRADQQKSAAAPTYWLRRWPQTVGGAHKLSAAARRGAAGAQLYSESCVAFIHGR